MAIVLWMNAWFWFYIVFALQPEISDVILMGGGTRVPKVQEMLLKYLKRLVNTDQVRFWTYGQLLV